MKGEQIVVVVTHVRLPAKPHSRHCPQVDRSIGYMFDPGQKVKIDGVKFYAYCYHLRYDTGKSYFME